MTQSSMRFAIVVLLAFAGPAHAEVPRPVARAFLDNGIPMTHVAIVVQEVGKPRPLFAFDPDRPMNPASVMKLVTTFAALEILGPDYQWKTEAYAGGPIADGTLHGDLILKGYGDPKITLEQWQSFIASLRDTGLTTIDGDLGLDRSSFQLPPHDPAAFDGEALRPYNVGPDALLVNFKSVRFIFAPNAANEVELRMEPPLPAVAVGALPSPAFGECNDWRSGLAARFDDHPDRAAVSFPGRYPLGCDERDLWVSLLDHPHYVYQMFAAYFNEAGGHFTGETARNARIAAALRHRARREQALEQRDGAADLSLARACDDTAARDNRQGHGHREALARATEALTAGSRARKRLRTLAPRAHHGGRPHAPAARRGSKQGTRRVRELPCGRRGRWHRAAPVSERDRRRTGASEDRIARRRACARGLRDRC